MTTRDTVSLRRQVIQALERLPDDDTLDDVIDCAVVVHKVVRGIAQAEAGQTVTQEEARGRFAR